MTRTTLVILIEGTSRITSCRIAADRLAGEGLTLVVGLGVEQEILDLADLAPLADLDVEGDALAVQPEELVEGRILLLGGVVAVNQRDPTRREALQVQPRGRQERLARPGIHRVRGRPLADLVLEGGRHDLGDLGQGDVNRGPYLLKLPLTVELDGDRRAVRLLADEAIPRTAPVDRREPGPGCLFSAFCMIAGGTFEARMNASFQSCSCPRAVDMNPKARMRKCHPPHHESIPRRVVFSQSPSIIDGFLARYYPDGWLWSRRLGLAPAYQAVVVREVKETDQRRLPTEIGTSKM